MLVMIITTADEVPDTDGIYMAKFSASCDESCRHLEECKEWNEGDVPCEEMFSCPFQGGSLNPIAWAPIPSFQQRIEPGG